ncbi:hypothetical protein EDD22DRAFT_958361 [Suillus occidentalis]|nr:hypothetical protein EDD22DRAFT_958361 [Suillus occidentalis]
MSFRVGYIYTPATSAEGPAILDWVSCSQLAVNGSFLKVAYVLPMLFAQTLGSEAIYEPVYMDLRNGEPLGIPNQLPIPTGWRMVCMYTDDDLNTRPVLQKVAEAVSLPEGSVFHSGGASYDGASYDGASLDDSDFLSVLNDWVDISSIPAVGAPMTPVSTEGALLSQASDNESVPLSDPTAATPTRFVTFLLTPLQSVTQADNGASTVPGASFTTCSPAVFVKGIIYEMEFIKTHFPFAYICIQDARALAKNYLTTCGMDSDAFTAFCTQAISEIVTVAQSAGQSPELGFQCSETGRTTNLDLYNKNAIKLVSSERDKFKKALKDNSLPLVDSKSKLRLQGFALNTKRPDEIISHITSLTGLTTWNGMVTSLQFTCDPQGVNLYRGKAILILLAYRILKPVHNHDSKRSLLQLFPEQYTCLPEHTIALVCAMDLRNGEHLGIPNQFPIPTGWRTVYMYIGGDFIARHVLQKVAEAVSQPEGSVFYPGGASLDGALLDDSDLLSVFNDWVYISSIPAI